MSRKCVSVGFLILLSLSLAIFGYVYASSLGGMSRKVFWYLFCVYDKSSFVFYGIIVALVALVYYKGLFSGLYDQYMKLYKERFGACLAVVWVLMGLACLFAYRSHPLAMDEYAPFFQAKVFSRFEVFSTYPTAWLDYLIPYPVQNYFFEVNHDTGAVISSYWPGYALLLAPFMMLGVPWLCNPSLSIASIILIKKICDLLYDDEQVGGLAVLVALSSSVFIVNGISFYSMAAHLTLNLAFVYFYLRNSWLSFFIAGLIGGYAMTLHNPLPHFLFACPWVLLLLFKESRRAMVMLLGYSITFSVLGAGWLWVKSALSDPSVVVGAVQLADSSGVWSLIINPVKSFLDFAKLPDAYYVLVRIASVLKVVVWASPFAVVLAALCNFGYRHSRVAKYEWLFMASMLLTFVAYIFIPFDQGHGWGYRYFFSAWVGVPLLGAVCLRNRIDEAFYTAFVFGGILTMLLYVPFKVTQVSSFVGDVLSQQPPLAEEEKCVAFHSMEGFYSVDVVQNDPWLESDIVYAILPPKNIALDILNATLDSPVVYGENQFGVAFVEGGEIPVEQ